MTTSSPKPQCKTCGAPAAHGGAHCATHYEALQRYLADEQPEPDAPDVYVPRLNGIRGVRNGGTARARRGMRRPRVGEELNFDGE